MVPRMPCRLGQLVDGGLWGDEGQLNAPLKVTRAFPATVTEPLAEQASWWWEL